MTLDASEEIEVELHNHFSFFVTGYKYMRSFQIGQWDGKIKLYNINTKKIYIGLLDNLRDFACVNGYELVGSDIELIPEFTKEYIESWIDSQVITAGDDIIELRDYQYQSISNCLFNKRQLIVCPTGSGKTLIQYCIAKFLVEHGKKVLLQTDTTNLVSQMFKDWVDYSQQNGFDVEKNVQMIYGDFDRKITKSITLSTWQSQNSERKKGDYSYFNNMFDVIMQDECHKASAASISSILEACSSIEYRMGFTGSLKKSKTDKLQLEGLLGRIFKPTTTRELIDRGELADIKINVLMLKYDKLVNKALKDTKYQEQIQWILNHENRNRFIINIAADQKGNSLVLFHSEDHGKLLLTMAKEMYPDIPMFFINGGVETDDRESIRAQIENLTKSITFGSFGTVSTGWSVKNLHNMILAHPWKAPIKIIQSIGRLLRISKTKNSCKMFDICDILVNSGKRNYLKRHAQERVEIYIDEKLEFKTFEIPIKTL